MTKEEESSPLRHLWLRSGIAITSPQLFWAYICLTGSWRTTWTVLNFGTDIWKFKSWRLPNLCMTISSQTKKRRLKPEKRLVYLKLRFGIQRRKKKGEKKMAFLPQEDHLDHSNRYSSPRIYPCFAFSWILLLLHPSFFFSLKRFVCCAFAFFFFVLFVFCFPKFNK